MAGTLPTVSKPGAAPAAPVAEPKATKTINLAFDSLEALPDAAVLAVNVFADEVARLSRQGGASSTDVDNEDVKWARDMIRRACAAIKRGAKTKVLEGPAFPEGQRPVPAGKTRVYFAVGDKSDRGPKPASK